MMISYKYPIFPGNITQWKLAENLDACRWLYIPYLKLENPKLNLVYSKVLQMANYTLWSNFKGLAASMMNGRKIEGCIKAVITKREGLKEKGHNNDMWSKFIFMLSYKAQSAGRKLIKIDPRSCCSELAHR